MTERKVPDEIVVRTADGDSIGHVREFYVGEPDSPGAVARIEWDGVEHDSLIPVELHDIGADTLPLAVTRADLDAGQFLADDKVDDFLHEALAKWPTITPDDWKKVKPGAAAPGSLPPIKVIKPGMVLEEGS